MNNKLSSHVAASAELLGVILGGTDSLLKLKLQNSFKFEKINLLESKFKDKLIMPNGSVNLLYSFNQLPPITKEKINFICITKKATVPCPINAFSIDQIIGRGNREIFNHAMEVYKEEQENYISKLLTILRLYKDGNIEIPSTFYWFEGRYAINQLKFSIDCIHSDCQTVFDNYYTIEESECEELNCIIKDNMFPIKLLEIPINKFEIGCKELRDEIAFKELITTNEVLFIGHNSKDKCENGKKEKLSNRMSVWIATNDQELQLIHDEIMSFYKYRSSDTHEANSLNITPENTKKLREYTRRALKKYFKRTIDEQSMNINITFNEIKYKIVSEIISVVSHYKLTGLLY